MGEPEVDPSPGCFPIRFEELDREARQTLSLDNWDGFRLEAQKAVSKTGTKHSLAAAHSLFLGTTLRPEKYIYQFGPTFQSEKGDVIFGRMGLDGSRMVRCITKVGKASELMCVLNSERGSRGPPMTMVEFEGTTSGSDWTASVKPGYQPSVPTLEASMSQMVTPSLHVGAKLVGMMPPANPGMMPPPWGSATVMTRFSAGDHTVNVSFERGSDQENMKPVKHTLKAMYHHKAITVQNRPRLNLATEFEVSQTQGVPAAQGGMASSLRLGWEWFFFQARVQGLLDSTGKVKSTIQSNLYGFSAEADLWNGDYKFGFMLQVMPQEGGQPQ
jgi:mitochondrial import receptor subunit TOM40